MAVDMSETQKLLKKLSNVFKNNYKTLEVDGRNGPCINFEKTINTIEIDDDEMYGDQMFNHPVIKKIKGK